MTSRQTATIIVSLIVLGIGFWLYATAATPYDQCQSTLAGIAQALNQSAAAHCGDVSTRYHGSFGIMGLGVILFLLGLFGSKGRTNRP